VLEAAKYLKKELISLIPGDGNFFKNFLIFDLKRIQGLKEENLSSFGNVEISNLSQYYFKEIPYADKELILFE